MSRCVGREWSVKGRKRKGDKSKNWKELPRTKKISHAFLEIHERVKNLLVMGSDLSVCESGRSWCVLLIHLMGI